METERLLSDLKGRKIRCILFDLGDTLWTQRDENAVHQIVTQRGIGFLNGHLEPQDRLEKTTKSYQQLKAAIDAKDPELLETIYHTTLDTTASPSQTAAVQEALADLNLPRLDHTTCSGLLEALRISRTDKRVLFDDTHSTLIELQ